MLLVLPIVSMVLALRGMHQACLQVLGGCCIASKR